MRFEKFTQACPHTVLVWLRIYSDLQPAPRERVLRNGGPGRCEAGSFFQLQRRVQRVDAEPVLVAVGRAGRAIAYGALAVVRHLCAGRVPAGPPDQSSGGVSPGP